MPAITTHRPTGITSLTCRACGTHVATTDSAHDRGATDLSGRPVSETFAYNATTGVFYGNCRPCGRARAAARRAAGTPRRASATMRRPLGNARKFGVELETVNSMGVTHEMVARALRDAGLNARTSNYSGSDTGAWLVKSDGSLTGGTGIEITSPALSGEAGLNALRTACRILNELGLTVNRSCGTHVHHDAADLTVDEIKRFVSGWSRNQQIVDGLVAPSRRNGAAYYARPLSSLEVATVQRATTLAQIRSTSIDRYRTLNLRAYGKFGTLEIRQHQGTISFAKIAAWVALGQAFIDSAIVGEIPATHSARTLFDAMGERLGETARTFLTGRAVEFGAVAV